MNIVYLHQYFVTPEEWGATRSYWFARKLPGNRVLNQDRKHQDTMQINQKVLDFTFVVY